MLRDPRTRDLLLSELAVCDRLVVLGDLLELRHGPLREAMAAAEEPLRAVGSALAQGAEVVFVAGNHDHHLIHGWTERRALDGPPPPLGSEAEVDWRQDEPLGRIAELLAPARLRATYPGIWLRDDVYATHGHYLDLHITVPTLERLGAAAMGRVVGLDGSGPRTAEDYESVLVPLYEWIDAIAQLADPDRSRVLHGGSVRGWNALTGSRRRTLRGRAVRLAWPAAIAGLNRAGLGPLRPELSGAELRSAGLRALTEVVARIGVETGHVLFGHTHRAGPLPTDDPAEWCTIAGTRLTNSGCWVHEPAFLGPDPAHSPYRAGFAVVLDSDAAPELVNLLQP